MKAWRPLLTINLLAFGAVATWIIVDKEDQLRHGRVVLLEVTHYDPRSLLQGDHLVLTYLICSEIERQLDQAARGEGQAVLGVDADDVGRLRRLHAGEPLAAGEVLLHYRIRQGRTGRVRVAAEEFFFQEGLAAEFGRARYAELRVTPDGRTLLVALRDDQRRRIGGKS